MPLNPAQIKDKLLSALDESKNVVDQKAVEEVITLLENRTLTKENLEQTRLGRDINLARKTIQDPAVAKRARKLLKSWQKLIPPGSPQVNGHVKSSPGLQQLSPGLSPAIRRAANSTNARSAQSPAFAQVRRQQQKTGSSSPSVSTSTKNPQKLPQRSPAVSRCPSQNEDSNLSWPSSISPEFGHDRLRGGPDINGSSKNDETLPKTQTNFESKPSDHSFKNTKSANRASDQRDVSKTNVANRKRTRAETKSDDIEPPSSKHQRTSSPCLSSQASSDIIHSSSLQKNGKNVPITSNETPKLVITRQDSSGSRSVQSVECRTPRERTSKVKTTEQLIEDMQFKSSTPVIDPNLITQIKTNTLKKETENQKLVNGGKSKRGRKKKNQQLLDLPDQEASSDVRNLAQAKNEHIERFLESVPDKVLNDASAAHGRQESLEEQPIELGECSNTYSQRSYHSTLPLYPTRQDKPDSGPSASPPEVRDLENASHNSATNPSEKLSAEQLEAGLPPIDYNNIDWSIHDYSPPQPLQVGQGLVERLHNENMDSINGSYDRDGQFRRWSEMLTVDSVYEDPLYILPYVVLD